MGYLLDTNIVSDMMRNPRSKVDSRVEAVGSTNILTSALVIAEVEYGLRKLPSKRLRRRLDQLVSTIKIADFSLPAAVAYGQIRHALARRGKPIGGIDLLIAAQALSEGHIMVTANEREFARIPGLRVENWLR